MWANKEVMTSMGQGVMAGSIQDVTEFISALPEFPDLLRMCDLGGNHGFYTMAMLDRNPQLKGTVYDLPEVARLAKEVISEMGYSDRIDTIGCDLETDGSIGKGYLMRMMGRITPKMSEDPGSGFTRDKRCNPGVRRLNLGRVIAYLKEFMMPGFMVASAVK